MSLPAQIAKHFREVHFGGNWTTSNLRDQLKDVSWQQAIEKVNGFNTIAQLTYHTTYYVSALLRVLQGQPLDASDKVSFDHPLIQNDQDWELLQQKAWTEVEQAAALIEQLPETILLTDFTDAKYGNYYRNIHGIIEHTHYHLGQVAILKKLLQERSANESSH